MTQLIERFRSSKTERLTLKEAISPRHLPEAAFQSYEELINDGVEQRQDFIDGVFRNPDLKYRKLQDLSRMDNGIMRLYGAAEYVRQQEPDAEKANIIVGTFDFRIAEMEYIKLLSRLNFLVSEKASVSEVRDVCEDARIVGEALYGSPEVGLRDAAYAEVWRQIDSKQLSASAQKIRDELRDGFDVFGRHNSGLPRPESTTELPSFGHPSIRWAGEIVKKKTTDIRLVLNQFWNEKVKEHGDDYSANPQDIFEAFRRSLRCIDPDGSSGIDVVIDPESAILAWDTPTMSVKVGAKRDDITSCNELYKKNVHEAIIHGGRAVSGLESELPVLGTGLYTPTTQPPDYLTFEEGFAATIDDSLQDVTPTWNMTSLERTMAITLAQQGADFRDTYELLWRCRVLTELTDDKDPADKAIAKAKLVTYSKCVRAYRGTPTRMQESYPDILPLTFNKDLAYLNGRVRAMRFLQQLYEIKDEAGFMRLFEAKFDPTIPEQVAIVDKYM